MKEIKNIIKSLPLLGMIAFFACDNSSMVENTQPQEEITTDPAYFPSISSLCFTISFDHFPALYDTFEVYMTMWIQEDKVEIYEDYYGSENYIMLLHNYGFRNKITNQESDTTEFQPPDNTNQLIDSTFSLGDTAVFTHKYTVLDTGIFYFHAYPRVETTDTLSSFGYRGALNYLGFQVFEDYGEAFPQYGHGGLLDSSGCFWDIPFTVDFELLQYPNLNSEGSINWNISTLNEGGYINATLMISDIYRNTNYQISIYSDSISSFSSISGNSEFTLVDSEYSLIELNTELELFNNNIIKLSERKYLNFNGEIVEEISGGEMLFNLPDPTSQPTNIEPIIDDSNYYPATPSPPDGQDNIERDCEDGDCINLSGQIIYKDTDETPAPLINCFVSAYDGEYEGENVYLGTVSTDNEGNFYLDNIDFSEDGLMEIYLIVEMRSEEFQVISEVDDNPLYFIVNPIIITEPQDIDFDIQEAPSFTPFNESVWVFSYLNNAWSFVNSESDQSPDSVQAVVSTEIEWAHFEPDNQLIVIPEGSWTEFQDVTIHEYGHAIMYNAYNGESIPDAGGFHSPEDCYNQGLAWSEGWSHFLVCAVKNNGTIISPFEPLNIEDIPEYFCRDDINETRVAGALYDLWDNNNDGSDVNELCNISFNTIWSEVIWNSFHTGFLPFWEELNDDELIDNCQSFYGLGSILNNTIDYDYDDLWTNGDVDMSGTIDVIDIINIVEYILDNTSFNPFEIWSSDLNHNLSVDVLDIVLIVEIILNEEFVFNDIPEDAIILSKLIETKDDPQFVLNIQMQNQTDVRGLQFTIKIPDGLEPVYTSVVEHGGNMSVDSKFYDNGKLKLLMYDIEGGIISPGNGKILEIGLENQILGRDDDFDEGEFEDIRLTNTGNEYLEYLVLDPDTYARLIQDTEENFIPTTFNLYSPYPNPFNPITTITYGIPKESHVNILVYDLTGRKLTDIVNRTISAGSHTIRWDADGFPSGISFVKMIARQSETNNLGEQAGDYTKSQKVMLLN